MKLTKEEKAQLSGKAKELKGSERRIYMASIVQKLGKGGQRLAERELGWNRATTRKGMHELEHDMTYGDAFRLRGRKRSEEHLPNLMNDLKAIVDRPSQADPQLRTNRLYTRLTVAEVRRQLIADKGYMDEELPTEETIRTKLKQLGYFPKKGGKSQSPSATSAHPEGSVQKWVFPTRHDNTSSSPTVVNGVLYICTNNASMEDVGGKLDTINVYAIDANTGIQKWVKRILVDSESWFLKPSSPTVVNGVLYICTNNASMEGVGDKLDTINVYAIDANTGIQKWVKCILVGSKSWFPEPSSPTVVNGVLYVGFDKVYAIDANTGIQKWVFSPGSKVDTSPTVINGVLYIGTNNTSVEGRLDTINVYAIDANTGIQKWVKRIPIVSESRFPRPSSPTVINGVLYIGTNNTSVEGRLDTINVYAIDANTGIQKWVKRIPIVSESRFPRPSSPTVVNGVLYIGSDKVYAIDANTGQKIWDFSPGRKVDTSPTVVNGVLYIGSDKVYAIDANTGQKIWDFTTENEVRTMPRVANGVLYVSDSHGTVYALNLPAS